MNPTRTNPVAPPTTNIPSPLRIGPRTEQQERPRPTLDEQLGRAPRQQPRAPKQ